MTVGMNCEEAGLLDLVWPATGRQGEIENEWFSSKTKVSDIC